MARGHLWTHERFVPLAGRLANLGDALVATNKFDRAKEVYEQLQEREPESESAKRKLNDVLRKLGLLEPEAVPMVVPEQLGIPETLQAELPGRKHPACALDCRKKPRSGCSKCSRCAGRAAA